MTEKELKRLSRSELLELLLLQTRETERLQNLLTQAQAELAERKLRIAKTGNLAEAVLELNGVMQSAQAAAQQYLENMAAMEEETKIKCEAIHAKSQAAARKRLDEAAAVVEATKIRCTEMVAEARAEAARIREDARQEAAAIAPEPKLPVTPGAAYADIPDKTARKRAPVQNLISGIHNLLKDHN